MRVEKHISLEKAFKICKKGVRWVLPTVWKRGDEELWFPINDGEITEVQEVFYRKWNYK